MGGSGEPAFATAFASYGASKRSTKILFRLSPGRTEIGTSSIFPGIRLKADTEGALRADLLLVVTP